METEITEMTMEEFEGINRAAMDRKENGPIIVMEMTDAQREAFSMPNLADVRKRGMYRR